MENAYYNAVLRVNCLNSDLEAIYHQFARQVGISDSALHVLYVVHEKGGSCPLYDIRRESGISKQTINSALRKLEDEGILYLEQDKGRTKRVCLTEKGKALTDRTAAPLFEAECSAFNGWSDQEISQYLNLMEKYNVSFRQEIEMFERRTL